MKTFLTSAFVILTSSLLFAFGPGGTGGPGGGGQQPGGGGNQPDQPGGGGTGGGGGSFTYDTFLTDSVTSGGCIVYGDLMTGYVEGEATVAIPSAVTRIADGVLAGNASVTSVDATKAGLAEVPESFAAGCGGLVEAALPATVTAVGSSAFAMDSSLATFTGTGVTTVGDYAFFGCTSLVLPASATYEVTGEGAMTGVAYESEDGEVYVSEAAPLVTWIKAGGGVVSSLASVPSSCDTATLKDWLTNDVANLEAYLYADEIATNANFTALSVSGTNFLFTAQDLATLSVAHAALQVSTDLSTWKTVSESDIVDGVYTMSAPTNGFARIVYTLPW